MAGQYSVTALSQWPRSTARLIVFCSAGFCVTAVVETPPLLHHLPFPFIPLNLFSLPLRKKRMDTTPPSPSSPVLQWSNVGFGFAFIVMNMVLSQVLDLRIGTSLVVSAVRCMVQLTFVATILQRVFAAQNLWTVAAIARTSLPPFAFRQLIHSLGAFASALEYARRVRNW